MTEKEIAKELLDLVGGKDNVLAYEHCATRLRLFLKDDSVYEENKKEIEKVEKVKGSFNSTGQVQIILGTGLVNKVHGEFEKLVGETNTNIKNESYNNMNAVQKGARVLGDIFIPIIPVLVATGLFMGLRGLFMELNTGEVNETIFLLSQILTDTVFIFLPALVTMSTVKRFGGNPVIGLVAGLMMVSSSLPDAWAVASGSAEPIVVDGLIRTIEIQGYQGSVLPALIVGICIAYIEKYLHTKIPNALDLIVTPFLVLLSALILSLFFIGPFFYTIEGILVELFSIIMYLPFGIGGLFIGFFWQFLVITGLHHAFMALETALLADTGANAWNAIITGSIAAQGAAAIAVGLKSATKKERNMHISSASSAFLGITEPSIFGTNLPRVKPFVFACIGGACAGWLAALSGLAATGMALTVIPGMLLYLNGQLLGFIVVNLVAIVVAFVLTYLFWDEEAYQRGEN